MERVGPNQVQGPGFRIRFVAGHAPRIRYREGDRLVVFSGEWNSMRFAEPMSIYDDESSSRWQPPHEAHPIPAEHHALIVQRVQQAIRLTSGGRNATWITVPPGAPRPVVAPTGATIARSSIMVTTLTPAERWMAAALALFFSVGTAYMLRQHSLGFAAVMVVLVLVTGHAAVTGRNLFRPADSRMELERLEREW
jgi:hypothetical protein